MIHKRTTYHNHVGVTLGMQVWVSVGHYWNAFKVIHHGSRLSKKNHSYPNTLRKSIWQNPPREKLTLEAEGRVCHLYRTKRGHQQASDWVSGGVWKGRLQEPQSLGCSRGCVIVYHVCTFCCLFRAPSAPPSQCTCVAFAFPMRWHPAILALWLPLPHRLQAAAFWRKSPGLVFCCPFEGCTLILLWWPEWFLSVPRTTRP